LIIYAPCNLEQYSKKGFKQKLLHDKTSGKTKKQWTDVVQRDALQLLGIRGWGRRAKNRDEWGCFMRDAKARKGCGAIYGMEWTLNSSGKKL